MTKPNHLNSIGQRYHDFTLIKIVEIPELQCQLRELIHEPSGAIIMHIGNDDPENLFCLSFQTLPYNSNGVAHILEHTVLCGSKKFPVKDPFFAMNRRSLNTFMNALTGADFTCYPAATQVPKDFYNLLDVYLDAVFNPKLHELSFMQEGYRLEFAIPDDPTSPLEYKGIVFNEMKGALSSASSRLSEAFNAAIFPDITYGFNSGGDPKVIPQLTYQELKDFHSNYYHPSRCLFFFYGNLPLEGHLDFIAKNTLNQTSKVSRLPPIPPQPRFKKPSYHQLKYPIAPEEDPKEKTMIAFGWLTCHILEQEEVLALSILQIILMDTDASPLKLALLKSGLCKQVSSFIDTELSEIPWMITLKGCNPANADAIEDLLMTTLKEISSQEIPLQMLENAIHQLEFSRSEITGDHAPFGLSLFMRSALLKQHGAVPEQGLTIHSLFNKLHQEILLNPKYINSLIDKYLINNNHFVRILMQPDPHLGIQELAEEKRVLQEIKDKLTKNQIQQIINKAKELEEFQKKQEEEDIEVLPKITLKEVPLGPRNYPIKREQIGVLDVFHHNTFTNDIIYADLIFNLPNLNEDELPYLRLLTIVLTQMGSNGRDYIQNLEYIQGHTGGLGAGISMNLQAHDYHSFFPSLHLRGKALHRKASKLFPLMLETVTSTQLNDIERLKEVIIKHFTTLDSSLSRGALKYAINLSASGLSVPSNVTSKLYGLPYYWKLREIVQDIDKQIPFVLAKLQEILDKVMCLEHPDLVLSCSANTYDELKRHGFYGLKDMETHPFTPWTGDYPLIQNPSQGRIIASAVAYVGKVFPTISYTHPHAAALNIASFLFDNIVLHPRIREQGGAYGGGSVSNLMIGNFYFYSYRDPNISKTLLAFQEAVQTILDGEFDESDLEEAKLEMIQVLDNPVAPGSRAELAYGWFREGKTHEMRQNFRTRMLAVNRDDIINAVRDVIAPQMNNGTTVVFARKELLEKENEALKEIGLEPLIIENI